MLTSELTQRHIQQYCKARSKSSQDPPFASALESSCDGNKPVGKHTAAIVVVTARRPNALSRLRDAHSRSVAAAGPGSCEGRGPRFGAGPLVRRLKSSTGVFFAMVPFVSADVCSER